MSRVAAFWILLTAVIAGNCVAEDPAVLLEGDRERTFQIELSTQKAVYDIPVNGFVDGIRTRMPEGYAPAFSSFQLNRSVRLENIGPSDIVNPRISVNGRGPWLNVRQIVDTATAGLNTVEEKATALWSFVMNHRFHATTWDSEVNDPIKAFNVYGFTLCGNSSSILRTLLREAGIPNRRSGAVGHETVEAFYDGAYHMFDADTDSLFLQRDNHTVASQADLVRDHDLVKRTHTYSISNSESVFRDQMSASLYAERLEYDPANLAPRKPSEYSLILRPGEAIEWRWGPGVRSYTADAKQPGIPPGSAAHGLLTYEPDLTSVAAQRLFSIQHVRQTPAGYVPEQRGAAGELIWKISGPYVFVDGTVHVRVKSSGDDQVACEFSRNGRDWTLLEGKRTVSDQIFSLDSVLSRPRLPDYIYFIRIKLTDSGAADPPILESVRFDTEFQASTFSLPELETGRNRIEYADDSLQPRKVRIVHNWIERDSWRPPVPPVAVTPAPESTVPGTQVRFTWTAPGDPDGDNIVDYHIQVSGRKDMRWPISTTFDRVISRTSFAGKSEWIVPYPGLLNPREPYYWRVRARDAKGVWSDWSVTNMFRCSAPGVPLKLAAAVTMPQLSSFSLLSWIRGASETPSSEVKLNWQPAGAGSAPVKYRIYGSNEEGFSASNQRHGIFIGRGFCRDMKEFSEKADQSPVIAGGNLLGESTTTSWIVKAGSLRAFYRVTAMDRDGNESGPSDFALIDRTLFYTEPQRYARVGELYQYSAGAVYSLGSLTCKTPYTMAYWGRRRLMYELVRGPSWLKIDPLSGSLSGIPTSTGNKHIEIAVRQENGQEERQAFVLVVQ